MQSVPPFIMRSISYSDEDITSDFVYLKKLFEDVGAWINIGIIVFDRVFLKQTPSVISFLSWTQGPKSTLWLIRYGFVVDYTDTRLIDVILRSRRTNNKNL